MLEVPLAVLCSCFIEWRQHADVTNASPRQVRRLLHSNDCHKMIPVSLQDSANADQMPCYGPEHAWVNTEQDCLAASVVLVYQYNFLNGAVSKRLDCFVNGKSSDHILDGSSLPAHVVSARCLGSVPCLQMNGPPRPQGLKVVLKLPKAQPANKPGQTAKPLQSSSQLQGRQPVKKRKRTEERVSTPNGWPQHPTASADTPIHRAPGSFPRGDLGHPPGTKKSKASPAHPQISPRDPFAAPGQPSIKPRLTVKNSGSTPLPRPDWSSQQPGSGAGSLTAKVGSAPPSKQQKGLKSKKKPAPEFSQHQPVSPDANGFVKREGQEQDGLQRPKLKVKQPQGSHQPAPTLSETGLSEPSASAATEDDAAYQQEKPLGAAPLSNLAAAELRPDIPITRQDVTRVLDRVQQKDWYEIFKEPVTDDVVQLLSLPGLFLLVPIRIWHAFAFGMGNCMQNVRLPAPDRESTRLLPHTKLHMSSRFCAAVTVLC